ncbi:MAG: biosynthetic peptidoglycan transglycosylase [Pseudomonadota bacterium]
MQNANVDLKPVLYKVLKVILIVHVAVLGAGFILIYTCKYFNPMFTSLQLYRTVSGVKNEPVIFVPLSHVDAPLKKVLIKLEDPSFRTHSGVDFDALVMAYKINRRVGRNVVGGSTITQQLTRTLFLLPYKNYARKYLELILALEMDALLSKNRILELYFNYVEFGKGVYGIGQAAQHYFHKEISQLSVDQLTQLIIILPSPVKYSPKDIQRKSFFRKRYNILSRDPSLNQYVEEGAPD